MYLDGVNSHAFKERALERPRELSRHALVGLSTWSALRITIYVSCGLSLVSARTFTCGYVNVAS